MADMADICTDLQAECDALEQLLIPLRDADWDCFTPSEGWMVRDQISHLGTTDRVATLAAAAPERFTSDIRSQDRRQRAAQQLENGRSMSGAALLAWWRDGRLAMLEVFRRLAPQTRIPWFGPAMSAVSFATARLMETWAHGQDVVDALGLQRPATARLRHVAHIGVLARPFSFTVHGKTPPTEAIRVELSSPAGMLWTWGEVQTHNRVYGPALDFCLAVTQRRHVADTNLHIEGPVAQEWMQIAQAFAGPAGTGRQPGQFPKPLTSQT
jgi:uncharacterized protein (TIGR03084 family)